MGRMEEYYLWKKGELNKKMARESIEFFKTSPTDEQLMALEAMDKKTLTIVIIGLIAYALVGFLYGFLYINI